MSTKSKKTAVCFHLDPKTLKRVMRICKQSYRSRSEVLRELLESGLKATETGESAA